MEGEPRRRREPAPGCRPQVGGGGTVGGGGVGTGREGGGRSVTTRLGPGNYNPAAAPAYRATSDPSKRVAWESGRPQRPAGEARGAAATNSAPPLPPPSLPPRGAGEGRLWLAEEETEEAVPFCPRGRCGARPAPPRSLSPRPQSYSGWPGKLPAAGLLPQRGTREGLAHLGCGRWGPSLGLNNNLSSQLVPFKARRTDGREE